MPAQWLIERDLWRIGVIEGYVVAEKIGLWSLLTAEETAQLGKDFQEAALTAGFTTGGD